MKKILVCLLALLMLGSFAFAEMPYESIRMEFEDGFALDLPSDWMRYDVDAELADRGFIYCLGASDASRLLYVQRWAADYATLSELQEDLAAQENVSIGANISENATFLMYTITDSDCSGCMTLFDGSVLNLLFTPQSDAENMLIAATIIESYESLKD